MSILCGKSWDFVVHVICYLISIAVFGALGASIHPLYLLAVTESTAALDLCCLILLVTKFFFSYSSKKSFSFHAK